MKINNNYFIASAPASSTPLFASKFRAFSTLAVSTKICTSTAFPHFTTAFITPLFTYGANPLGVTVS